MAQGLKQDNTAVPWNEPQKNFQLDCQQGCNSLASHRRFHSHETVFRINEVLVQQNVIKLEQDSNLFVSNG